MPKKPMLSQQAREFLVPTKAQSASFSLCGICLLIVLEQKMLTLCCSDITVIILTVVKGA